MEEKRSDQNYFLVQVSRRGSINILKNSKYRNPRWAGKPRDRAHGLVKPGDTLVVYFTSGAIDYQKQLRLAYKVADVSSGNVEFELERLNEIDPPLTLNQIRQRVSEGSLSSVFRKCGQQGFNICELDPSEYEEIFEISGPPTPFKPTISLERDLENFLADKLDDLEKGLEIYKGETGRQFQVQSGRIDLLVQDRDKNFVVVELKAGTANDSVLAQILAYMANIADEFPGKEIRGIIIAYNFADRLVTAASLVPTVKLMRYKVNFRFEDVA